MKLSQLTGFSIHRADLAAAICTSDNVLNTAEQSLYLSNCITVRELVLALIFLTTSISLSDSLALQWSDIQSAGGGRELRVQGMRGVRYELIDSQLQSVLEKWLSELGDAESCGLIFPGPRGAQLGAAFILKKVGWRAGLDVSYRTLRNTWRANRYNRVS